MPSLVVTDFIETETNVFHARLVRSDSFSRDALAGLPAGVSTAQPSVHLNFSFPPRLANQRPVQRVMTFASLVNIYQTAEVSRLEHVLCANRLSLPKEITG